MACGRGGSCSGGSCGCAGGCDSAPDRPLGLDDDDPERDTRCAKGERPGRLVAMGNIRPPAPQSNTALLLPFATVVVADEQNLFFAVTDALEQSIRDGRINALLIAEPSLKHSTTAGNAGCGQPNAVTPAQLRELLRPIRRSPGARNPDSDDYLGGK